MIQSFMVVSSIFFGGTTLSRVDAGRDMAKKVEVILGKVSISCADEKKAKSLIRNLLRSSEDRDRQNGTKLNERLQIKLSQPGVSASEDFSPELLKAAIGKDNYEAVAVMAKKIEQKTLAVLTEEDKNSAIQAIALDHFPENSPVREQCRKQPEKSSESKEGSEKEKVKKIPTIVVDKPVNELKMQLIRLKMAGNFIEHYYRGMFKRTTTEQLKDHVIKPIYNNVDWKKEEIVDFKDHIIYTNEVILEVRKQDKDENRVFYNLYELTKEEYELYKKAFSSKQ